MRVLLAALLSGMALFLFPFSCSDRAIAFDF